MITIKYIYPYLKNKFKEHKYKKLLTKSNIQQIDRLDGFEFEEYLTLRFNKLGYRSLTTKKTKDFGADVVLTGENVIRPVVKLDISIQLKRPFITCKKYYTSRDNKIVIQAKRYNSKVGMSAIQEVYTAKKYYNADEAWVVTNNYYTDSAKELAKICKVKLLDRNELMNFIIHPEKFKDD